MKILGWTTEQFAEAKAFYATQKGAEPSLDLNGMIEVKMLWQQMRHYEPGQSPIVLLSEVGKDVGWAATAIYNTRSSTRLGYI